MHDNKKTDCKKTSETLGVQRALDNKINKAPIIHCSLKTSRLNRLQDQTLSNAMQEQRVTHLLD